LPEPTRDAVHGGAERERLERLITPTTLRQSYATHLADSDVDLAVVLGADEAKEPQ
jgi:site-specific recombinase XerC